MSRSRFQTARVLALTGAVTAGLVLAAPISTAGAAVPRAARADTIATLKIQHDSVEVKKKGDDSFTAAEDGQNLHEGDTVRTDGTGLAEVDYSEDTYTRLDVNTTFTIKKLSDDQGNRQVEGTLDTGKAWNRTAALTESQSFEQTGAGATAAIVGSANATECDATGHCTVIAVVDVTNYTGANGVSYSLQPLDSCDSTNGVLCQDITHLTPAELDSWIQTNLRLDLELRGICDALALIDSSVPCGTGTVVVQNGQAVFIPAPPAAATTSQTSTTPPPPPPPPPAPPVFGTNPVTVTGSGGLGYVPTPTGPNTAITTEDDQYTFFTASATDPQSSSYTLSFTTLPDGTVGVLCAPTTGTVVNPCAGTGAVYTPVPGYEAIVDAPISPTVVYNTTTQFPSDTQFAFAPADYENTGAPAQTQFTMQATNTAGATSAPKDVPVTVFEDDAST